MANRHLELSQLWRCPVVWCTQWKGTQQDCVYHIRLVHAVPTSVKAVNLGKWFPPWTDALLFSQCGTPLIHHYRVFGWGGAYASLHMSFMSRLRAFTVQADADGHLARKWDSERLSRGRGGGGGRVSELCLGAPSLVALYN